MEKLCVDRIEGNIVVCEDEDNNIIKISLLNLPKDVKEGNVLIVYDDGKVELDYETEKVRKEKMISLQNNLFK